MSIGNYTKNGKADKRKRLKFNIDETNTKRRKKRKYET